MNLALTAASLDNLDSDALIGKKKRDNQQQNNKTRKQINFQNMQINDEKVKSVLESIHNKPAEDDDDNYNFNPPSKPVSIGAERKKEGMTNNSLVPVPLDQSDMDLQKLETNYMNEDEVKQYYRKIMPGYQELANIKINSNTNSNSNHNSNLSQNSVIDKLNYIINLLEEQQDQKTNNVTEEVILYSFLGIFIIFVVDGFTKVGKYVR